MKTSLLQKLEQMVERREGEPGFWRLAGAWQVAPANAAVVSTGAGFRAGGEDVGACR